MSTTKKTKESTSSDPFNMPDGRSRAFEGMLKLVQVRKDGILFVVVLLLKLGLLEESSKESCEL